MKQRKSINSYESSRKSRVRFSWDFDRPPHHPTGAPARYYFQGESLARGLEAAFVRRDPLILAMAGEERDLTEILAVDGAIVAENNYAIEVIAEVKCVGRKSFRGRLVVARNDKELAQLLKAEARHLTALAARLGKAIFPPLKVGILFLPDRQRRVGQNRRVVAYTTQVAPSSVYCGIGGPDQLRAYEPSPRLFSRDATDAIKARVFELCLRSFDPNGRTAMPPPDLQRGTLRIATKQSSRSGPASDVVIAGCPYLWDHIDHVGLLHRLTGFGWKEGARAMPLLPIDQGLRRTTLIAAIGKESARAWTKDYAAALDQGRYKPHHRFGLEDLHELRETLAR